MPIMVPSGGFCHVCVPEGYSATYNGSHRCRTCRKLTHSEANGTGCDSGVIVSPQDEQAGRLVCQKCARLMSMDVSTVRPDEVDMFRFDSERPPEDIDMGCWNSPLEGLVELGPPEEEKESVWNRTLPPVLAAIPNLPALLRTAIACARCGLLCPQDQELCCKACRKSVCVECGSCLPEKQYCLDHAPAGSNTTELLQRLGMEEGAVQCVAHAREQVRMLQHKLFEPGGDVRAYANCFYGVSVSAKKAAGVFTAAVEKEKPGDAKIAVSRLALFWLRLERFTSACFEACDSGIRAVNKSLFPDDLLQMQGNSREVGACFVCLQPVCGAALHSCQKCKEKLCWMCAVPAQAVEPPLYQWREVRCNGCSTDEQRAQMDTLRKRLCTAWDTGKVLSLVYPEESPYLQRHRVWEAVRAKLPSLAKATATTPQNLAQAYDGAITDGRAAAAVYADAAVRLKRTMFVDRFHQMMTDHDLALKELIARHQSLQCQQKDVGQKRSLPQSPRPSNK